MTDNALIKSFPDIVRESRIVQQNSLKRELHEMKNFGPDSSSCSSSSSSAPRKLESDSELLGSESKPKQERRSSYSPNLRALPEIKIVNEDRIDSSRASLSHRSSSVSSVGSHISNASSARKRAVKKQAKLINT